MSGVLRLGILGCAHDHAHFWARAINDAPDAILVGIWDDDDTRGERMAHEYDTAYFPELARLLERCDAVGITSTTARHAVLIEAAAAAGVHILCEKPLATSLPECDRIARAVAASRVTFMQQFPKRFDPVNHELAALVRRGELGAITLIRIRHGHAHGLDPSWWAGWYTDPAASGGGTLLDEGIHAADLLRWLLGDPTTVQAMVGHTLGLPVEDTATATFRFPSGALGEVTTSWTFLAAEQSVEIYGTQGCATLSGVDLATRGVARPPYLRVFRRGSGTEGWRDSLLTPRFMAGGATFHGEGVRRFIACLRQGSVPPTGVAEGRRALAMIAAAYRAAATGMEQAIVSGEEGVV